jgi:hypothetical protein
MRKALCRDRQRREEKGFKIALGGQHLDAGRFWALWGTPPAVPFHKGAIRALMIRQLEQEPMDLLVLPESAIDSGQDS